MGTGDVGSRPDGPERPHPAVSTNVTILGEAIRSSPRFPLAIGAHARIPLLRQSTWGTRTWCPPLRWTISTVSRLTTPEEGRLLDVPVPSALVQVESWTGDAHGQYVEFSRERD